MHVPVLLHEVLRVLDPSPGEFVIDGTVGGGGHARALTERIKPDGIFLGIDWDNMAIEKAREVIEGEGLLRIVLRHGNYTEIPEILESEKLGKANILFLDLGFSTDQLIGRGFSFRKDEPLVMTYNDGEVPAYTVLRQMKERELAKIIRELSDEKYANRIAEAIIAHGKTEPIRTTGRLGEIIRGAVPKNYERGRIDPATRTFMALRIYVNDELGNLEKLLRTLEKIMKPGGRIAIISFHSKEDRLVKNYFRELAKDGSAELLNKKPITATTEEISNNPKSRSAKLRSIKLI